MKIIHRFLPALALILTIPATAQTTSASRVPLPATTAFSRWSLSLETGPAFPAGEFQRKNPSSTSAGGARTGFAAGLGATYRFRPSFGLTMSAAFQENPEATMPLIFGDPGPVQETGEFIKHDSWKIGRLLAGVVYEKALSKNKRLALQIRAMAGLVKTGIPSFKYVYTSTGEYELGWKYSHLTPGFAFQGDAGLKYAITKRLSALVNAGYSGSRFTGRFSYDIFNSDGSSFEGGKASKTIALGTIQCRAGVEIRL